MSGRLECCCWRHLQADSTESSAQGAVCELPIEAIATNAFDCQAQFCTHYRGPLLTCCCCCAEAVDALAGRNRAGGGLPVIAARVCNLAGRLMSPNETQVANWARAVPFGCREMPVQDAEERLKQSA